jgi:hypothetical protein
MLMKRNAALGIGRSRHTYLATVTGRSSHDTSEQARGVRTVWSDPGEAKLDITRTVGVVTRYRLAASLSAPARRGELDYRRTRRDGV